MKEGHIPTIESLPKKKFLMELSKQTTIGVMKLEQEFNKFNKQFRLERYAQEAFKIVAEQTLVTQMPLKHEVAEFFMKNDPREIAKQPLRIKGKLIKQDDKSHWQAEIYLEFRDWENPGIVTTDTLTINTKKEVKKEALDVLNDMAATVGKEAMSKFGKGGQVMNLKTGKAM